MKRMASHTGLMLAAAVMVAGFPKPPATAASAPTPAPTPAQRQDRGGGGYAPLLPNNPVYGQVSAEDGTLGCDQYASHPLDPMKPGNVRGVAGDAATANDAAYVYCHRALIADQENPRILFQWGRVNLARAPQLHGQPRQMFRMAYENGSEIAGIYLAQLPPEPGMEELRQQFRRSMQARRAQQGNAGAEQLLGTPAADELLLGSIVTIYSAALLRVLSGNAEWGDRECSGGYMLDTQTHEVLCNGFVVGSY